MNNLSSLVDIPLVKDEPSFASGPAAGRNSSKGKVFNGQEPPSGESTTTECGFNYQLLAVIYWSSPMGSSQLQSTTPATDHSVTDGRSNWLVAPPPYTGQYPLGSTYCTVQCGLHITRLTARTEMRTCDLRHARPTHCLCGHSGYTYYTVRSRKQTDLESVTNAYWKKITFDCIWENDGLIILNVFRLLMFCIVETLRKR